MDSDDLTTTEALRESSHVEFHRRTDRVLYWSEDNGQLYLPSDIDGANAEGTVEVDGFRRYKVPARIELTAEQLCVQDGDLLEALLRADQATSLSPDVD